MKCATVVLIVVLVALCGCGRRKPGCEYIVEFMDKAELIIKLSWGSDRAMRLAALKMEYEPKMKNAPPEAIQVAQQFVAIFQTEFDSWAHSGSRVVIGTSFAK